MKICILLLLATISIGTASATVGVSIVPSHKDANINDQFSLNVDIDPAGATVAGANVDISFNSSVLQVTSIVSGNFLPNFFTGTIDNSAGTIMNYNALCFGSGCGTTTPGTFMTINFQAKANGTIPCIIAPTKPQCTPVNIVRTQGKAIVTDPSGIELPSSINSGQVAIPPIPELSTFILTALGMIGLLSLVKLKKKD